MAKKKAGRRSGRNASQPNANQGEASSSNTAPASQLQQNHPAPAAPRAAIEPIAQTAQASTQEDAPPPAVDAAGLDPDQSASFQVVTRRRRPPYTVRPYEPRRAAPESDDEAYSRPGEFSADPRMDAYMRYMFGRLHDAISDPRLDFDEIMREIRELIASQAQDHAADWDAGIDGDEEEYQDSWDDEPAPVVVEARILQISTADDEHFPALGASRRSTVGAASSSAGPATWGSILRSTPLPARPLPAPPPTRAAAAVPRRTAPPPPPSKPPPAVRATALSLAALQKLAEDASVLLELYSKSATSPADDQLIASAFASVSTIHRHHRVASGAAQKLPANDEFVRDNACVICYAESADTVLLPCHHLVLCGVCVLG